MERQESIVGDLVSLKDGSSKDTIVFIWNDLSEENNQEVIINLPRKLIAQKRLKRVSNKSPHHLFSTYDYAFIKKYDLLKRNEEILGDAGSFLKEIIQTRGPSNYLSELVFLYLLQSQLDRIYQESVLVPNLMDAVFGNKYCEIKRGKSNDSNFLDVEQRYVAAITMQLCLTGMMFWLVKRGKNFSEIANTIITKDDRSMLQKLREDRALLEELKRLIEAKEHFVKAHYSPQNTDKNKPIQHALNQSFYNLFEKEVAAYSETLEENKKLIEEKGNNLGGYDLSQNDENLLTGKFPEMQKLFFGDLGENLPIKKIVRGKVSLDYKLQFYIPLFKWIMPHNFAESPKIGSAAQRKQHIRRIKDFMAGKI